MSRSILLSAGVAGVAALVIAGCGADSGSAVSSTSASSSSGSISKITTAKTAFGPALVDGSGRTLYVFAKDTGPKSTCSGACAANWPPFTAASAPKLTGAKLSLVPRADGKRQVAIDGHPLYRFTGDQSAGQVNGQGVDAFGAKWFVVSAGGKAVTAAKPASSSSSSSRPGYGY